ncbi:hypothetical protein [Pedobacter rhodius]|uniref:Uncharacterized protein n=1 Tax=Pedobacter rhodius TaxID=3004098 RepID=A0ABT4KUE9_9SPHI|nr:hypothetical protein [Pedobacter sp. SJ11]MCZ4222376.1 hypothetical protein [Pedobacter sp. SJ11]
MNNYLETGIAIALIFFVFSTVAYIFQELIAINLQLRGKLLKKSIQQLIEAKGGLTAFTTSLLSHPQIETLNKTTKSLTSYIPAANFSMAIIDLVCKQAGINTGPTFAGFQAGLQNLKTTNPNLETILSSIYANSNNIQTLQLEIEKWFNEYMERVSGWYKNNNTWITRLIAIGVALVFNLNMIAITQEIFTNSALRISLNEIAERKVTSAGTTATLYNTNYVSDTTALNKKYADKLADSTTSPTIKETLKKEKEAEQLKLAIAYEDKLNSIKKEYLEEIRSKDLPFNWECQPFKKIDPVTGKTVNKTPVDFLLMITGLLIGAAGISMGAPFWFDLMSKLVNVRRAGQKPK